MKINIQKRIMFIPIVNFITVFLWLRFLKKNNISPSFFMKKWIKIIVCFLIVVIPSSILASYINNNVLKIIVDWIITYVTFFIVSYHSVKAQQELGAP